MTGPPRCRLIGRPCSATSVTGVGKPAFPLLTMSHWTLVCLYSNPRLQIKSSFVQSAFSFITFLRPFSPQFNSCLLTFSSSASTWPPRHLHRLLLVPPPHTSRYCSLTFPPPGPLFSLPQSPILGPRCQRTPPSPPPALQPPGPGLDPAVPAAPPACLPPLCPSLLLSVQGESQRGMLWL